ncbi:MAG: hypothetical protein AB7S38_38730 [Vulcanimicrobiota bacterium]
MQPIQDHLSDTSEVLEEAKTQARDQAEKQKLRAAIRLENLSQALDQTAESLESPLLEKQLNKASSGVARAANRLADADLDEIYQSGRALARNHAPGFLAGSFVLGLALGRLLKASTKSNLGGNYEQ